MAATQAPAGMRAGPGRARPTSGYCGRTEGPAHVRWEVGQGVPHGRVQGPTVQPHLPRGVCPCALASAAPLGGHWANRRWDHHHPPRRSISVTFHLGPSVLKLSHAFCGVCCHLAWSVCISLISDDVEHFPRLLAICVAKTSYSFLPGGRVCRRSVTKILRASPRMGDAGPSHRGSPLHPSRLLMSTKRLVLIQSQVQSLPNPRS